jgi:hypothetical protein
MNIIFASAISRLDRSEGVFGCNSARIGGWAAHNNSCLFHQAKSSHVARPRPSFATLECGARGKP